MKHSLSQQILKGIWCEAALFNGLFNKMFQTVTTCTQDVHGELSPELCLGQFDGSHNPNDHQFDGCKKAMTCAVKKLDYMNNNGEWKMDKLMALRNGIKSEAALKEFDGAIEACGSVTGKNGEAVSNMVSCLLNHSDRARRSYNELRDTFIAGYDE